MSTGSSDDGQQSKISLSLHAIRPRQVMDFGRDGILGPIPPLISCITCNRRSDVAVPKSKAQCRFETLKQMMEGISDFNTSTRPNVQVFSCSMHSQREH